MGRAYGITGIGINFGGSIVPSTTNLLEFGTTVDGAAAAIHYDSGNTRLMIECPANNILISTDSGNISVISTGTVRIGIDTILRITKGAGAGLGTVAELGTNGNLRIAGTLETGVTF